LRETYGRDHIRPDADCDVVDRDAWENIINKTLASLSARNGVAPGVDDVVDERHGAVRFYLRDADTLGPELEAAVKEQLPNCHLDRRKEWTYVAGREARTHRVKVSIRVTPDAQKRMWRFQKTIAALKTPDFILLIAALMVLALLLTYLYSHISNYRNPWKNFQDFISVYIALAIAAMQGRAEENEP
jgi:hypothetical protein